MPWQVVQLSFVEGMAYRLIKGWMISSMKKKIQPNKHDRIHMCFGSSDEFRKVLNVKNRLVDLS